MTVNVINGKNTLSPFPLPPPKKKQTNSGLDPPGWNPVNLGSGFTEMEAYCKMTIISRIPHVCGISPIYRPICGVWWAFVTWPWLWIRTSHENSTQSKLGWDLWEYLYSGFRPNGFFRSLHTFSSFSVAWKSRSLTFTWCMLSIWKFLVCFKCVSLRYLECRVTLR